MTLDPYEILAILRQNASDAIVWVFVKYEPAPDSTPWARRILDCPIGYPRRSHRWVSEPIHITERVDLRYRIIRLNQKTNIEVAFGICDYCYTGYYMCEPFSQVSKIKVEGPTIDVLEEHGEPLAQLIRDGIIIGSEIKR